MMEESMDPREDLQEPENGGTRGGLEPDDSDPGADDQYPNNGGTRGTAPRSAAAEQQHPNQSTETGPR